MSIYADIIRNAEQMGLEKLVNWANEVYQKKKSLFEQ